MRRYGLLYILIISLFFVQVARSQSAPEVQKPAAQKAVTPVAAASDKSAPAKTSQVALDAPVITVDGLCDHPEKAAPSACKTVVTRSQFERVVDAIHPGMPARARREFALNYVDFLMMAKKAEQMGLDSGPSYEEQLEIARIQILAKALIKATQEKFSKISDKDIEDFYNNNRGRFETAEMERIFVPKASQPAATSDPTLNSVSMQEGAQGWIQAAKREADTLYARAIAGEDFARLQAEAYQLAGIKTPGLSTNVKVRRTSLPPNQAVVMDLKPGEISPVLADPNGYVIYKVGSKVMMPVDQAREEIITTLRSQRMQQEMSEIRESATPTLDDRYFPSRSQQETSEGGKPSSKP